MFVANGIGLRLTPVEAVALAGMLLARDIDFQIVRFALDSEDVTFSTDVAHSNAVHRLAVATFGEPGPPGRRFMHTTEPGQCPVCDVTVKFQHVFGLWDESGRPVSFTFPCPNCGQTIEAVSMKFDRGEGGWVEDPDTNVDAEYKVFEMREIAGPPGTCM